MKLKLKVYGMDCIACSKQVVSILRKIGGIASAKANFASSTIEIECSSYPDFRLVEQKLSRFGYSLPKEKVTLKTDQDAFEANKESIVHDIPSFCSYEKTKNGILLFLYPISSRGSDILTAFRNANLDAEIVKWDRGSQDAIEKEQVYLLRNLVASVLLSTPILWNPSPYVQFALATLILVIPGRVFFKGVIRALHGGLNMDLLILLSSCLVYGYSSYLAFTVHEDIKLYFLCEGVLISLVLFGRYLEILAKGNTEKSIRGFVSLLPHKARILDGKKERFIDIDEVKINDCILVKTGERIPNDGVVSQGEGIIDESLLTGESLPVKKAVGDCITGGTLLRQGEIMISVTRIGKDTSLEQMIEIVSQAQLSSSPIRKLADKIVSVFIPCVICCAILVFFLWFYFIDKGNLQQAILCSAGVLVVSCPCALGLALPTSIMVGNGKSTQMGILFKNPTAIEKMRKIKVIAFDKTGTLTFGGEDSSRNLLRDNVKETIEELSKKYKVAMISGDKEEIAKDVASKAGIDTVYYEVKPEEKAMIIDELKKEGMVMMIGDGVNDAPALAKSDLSVSIQNGTDIARDAAEIIILGDDVSKIPLAFSISKKIMMNIYENLLWATLYNAICIPLAAIGLINPSIASAAMSFSSIAVLMNALRLNGMKGKDKNGKNI